MTQQIRIQRKSASSISAQQAEADANALDLRTPSGKKLPY